ncbi:MAG TPA: acetyl-CoA carboxylase carboxyltransferase subunit alpha [Alphaproteobacteria bacterium]|nr:acetyl-CoA carboxylase carboxyltransferase subunit alpha [Alphaproteobacteria bacterium]
MPTFLDFEKPIAELEGKIEELRHLANAGDLNIAEEVSRLQIKVDRLLRQTYAKLTPWQKTLVARHPERPHLKDYIHGLVEEFTPLAGDRLYADDPAVIGGIGRLRGWSAMIIGQEKGSDTETRVRHNFGMAKPEGYRKAQRLMRLANHFSLPVVSLVDTPGAYPGVGAEERGQAEAIARCIATCLEIDVPLVSIIIGEGGSGGAIALAAANTVLMLEHAVYSVISPEGCASILWRSAEHAQDAAEALKLTAADLFRLKVIDAIVPEPLGGAHRDRSAAIDAVGDALEGALAQLRNESGNLKARRREKFLAMGTQMAEFK